MIKKIFEMISGYASEEGFTVYGGRLKSKQRHYEMILSKRYITVYLNGQTKPFYRIESIKDGVNFCLIMSSIEQTSKICIQHL